MSKSGPGTDGLRRRARRMIRAATLAASLAAGPALAEDVIFYPGHGDDGDLKSSRADYKVYASRQHSAELCGDVEWTKS